jgi:hypothetical protein
VGYAAAATTTPQEFVFEQPAGADLVLNGSFASDTNWVKGTNWAIGTGDASCIQAGASTSSLSQVSIVATAQTEYRLTYTVSELSGTAAAIQPSLGNSVLTSRTADGTYIEDFTFAGTATLGFEFSATSAATGTIDNVILIAKPEAGWVDFLDLHNTNGALTVEFLFNCNATDFGTAYAADRTMILEDRAGQPLVLGLNGQSTPIYNMWYRTVTGTESFTINAR